MVFRLVVHYGLKHAIVVNVGVCYHPLPYLDDNSDRLDICPVTVMLDLSESFLHIMRQSIPGANISPGQTPGEVF